jgi:phage shock protein E
VPGARNVSHDQLAAKLPELGELKDKQVVLYCRSGRRSQLAAETLGKAGFTKLRHLEGDYLAWEAAQRPIER